MPEVDALDQRRQFESYLIRKAWKDPAFRKELVADPSGVFLRELKALDPNATLEGPIQIKIVEEAADQAYLVLPLNPASLELNESELDHVVGGGCTCKNQGCNKVVCVRINCNLSAPTGLPTFSSEQTGGGGIIGV